MPIERVKKSVKKATHRVRRHWSRDEAHRRQAMADVMQMQLLTALGFMPAPAPAAAANSPAR
jgi:hypothetical protein